jgi:esterase
LKLFFRKTGEGPPLVILHGLYGSSDNWMGIAGKLSLKYTVFCIDLRNHGRSPHAPEHTYTTMKNDLVEFAGENIPGSFSLLGHSMGGKVAMWFAADFPEKIRNLIIVDIAPKDYLLPEEESQYHLHRNIIQALRELTGSRLSDRTSVEERLTEKIDDKGIIRFLLKNVVLNRVTRQVEWRLNMEAIYDNLEEIVGGVNSRWFEDRLPITAYPVTFIRGLESPYIGEKDIPEIRKIYPEAEIVDIPRAGHWLHAQEPELFLEAVFTALKKKGDDLTGNSSF